MKSEIFPNVGPNNLCISPANSASSSTTANSVAEAGVKMLELMQQYLWEYIVHFIASMYCPFLPLLSMQFIVQKTSS